jgi:hypothetical protein
VPVAPKLDQATFVISQSPAKEVVDKHDVWLFVAILCSLPAVLVLDAVSPAHDIDLSPAELLHLKQVLQEVSTESQQITKHHVCPQLPSLDFVKLQMWLGLIWAQLAHLN